MLTTDSSTTDSSTTDSSITDPTARSPRAPASSGAWSHLPPPPANAWSHLPPPPGGDGPHLGGRPPAGRPGGKAGSVIFGGLLAILLGILAIPVAFVGMLLAYGACGCA